MFEAMHLKTHALEYNFGASCVGNLFDGGSDLSRIEGGRGKKDIELCRKQPERGDVELTGLYETSKAAMAQNAWKLTNCITERMVRWMLTRWSPYTVIRLVELPIEGN
jgi:hypothetical protein